MSIDVERFAVAWGAGDLERAFRLLAHGPVLPLRDLPKVERKSTQALDEAARRRLAGGLWHHHGNVRRFAKPQVKRLGAAIADELRDQLLECHHPFRAPAPPLLCGRWGDFASPLAYWIRAGEVSTVVPPEPACYSEADKVAKAGVDTGTELLLKLAPRTYLEYVDVRAMMRGRWSEQGEAPERQDGGVAFVNELGDRGIEYEMLGVKGFAEQAAEIAGRWLQGERLFEDPRAEAWVARLYSPEDRARGARNRQLRALDLFPIISPEARVSLSDLAREVSRRVEDAAHRRHLCAKLEQLDIRLPEPEAAPAPVAPDLKPAAVRKLEQTARSCEFPRRSLAFDEALVRLLRGGTEAREAALGLLWGLPRPDDSETWDAGRAHQPCWEAACAEAWSAGDDALLAAALGGLKLPWMRTERGTGRHIKLLPLPPAPARPEHREPWARPFPAETGPRLVELVERLAQREPAGLARATESAIAAAEVSWFAAQLLERAAKSKAVAKTGLPLSARGVLHGIESPTPSIQRTSLALLARAPRCAEERLEAVLGRVEVLIDSPTTGVAKAAARAAKALGAAFPEQAERCAEILEDAG